MAFTRLLPHTTRGNLLKEQPCTACASTTLHSRALHTVGPRAKTLICHSSDDGNSGSAQHDINWAISGVPSYLQSSVDYENCTGWDEDPIKAAQEHAKVLWNIIRQEAQRDAESEPLLSSFLYASILAHDSVERSLAFVLSNRLANTTLLPTQLFEIFHDVLIREPDVRCGALCDMEACRERDPACNAFSQALLYYKGYHAIQTQRIAHALWTRGQKVMALALQSRMSEVFAVDIHPAARFGRGILLDHGTGVVIGETAVIGDNVSLLQNVTLGGTGKEVGDRHPKIGDNVLIGASATVLGNIQIGRGAQIAAGSLVLKPVPPHTMVAGTPAKEVGKVLGNPAQSMQQWTRKYGNYDPLWDPPRSGSIAAASASISDASTSTGLEAKATATGTTDTSSTSTPASSVQFVSDLNTKSASTSQAELAVSIPNVLSASSQATHQTLPASAPASTSSADGTTQAQSRTLDTVSTSAVATKDNEKKQPSLDAVTTAAAAAKKWPGSKDAPDYYI